MSKKPLKTIKSSIVSRSLALSKLMIQSGGRIAVARLQESIGSQTARDDVLKQNALSIVEELGRLKGSAMKVGQSLAMISEHFFPKEIAAILSQLNEASEEVSWSTMEQVLIESLGPQKYQQLEFESEAYASASLGQVYKAKIKATGQQVCVKVQYPGVAKSIGSDLAAIKALFKFSNLIPSYGKKWDAIFDEIKTMLKKETDYVSEAKNLESFKEWIGDDPKYCIPKLFRDFSSHNILTTSFEAGPSLNSAEVLAMPRARRQVVASYYAELFLRELLIYQTIQTDPHFGNYKVRFAEDPQRDQLILLDFGALRHYPKRFLKPYSKLIRDSLYRDDQGLVKAGIELGFLNEDDSHDLKEKFKDLCYLIIEPWMDKDAEGVYPDYFDHLGRYNWAESDLPQRISEKATKLSLAFRFRPPPKEIVFLDRRLAGVFTTLKALDAPFDAFAMIKKILAQSPLVS